MPESALIVACIGKSTSFFTEMLSAASIDNIAAVKSCGEARRFLLERDFDFVIIDSPLSDETGENFARHVAVKGVSQSILVVNSEHFDAVSAVCEHDGVLTVSKPVDKGMFWSALMLAKSAQNKLKRKQSEDEKLKLKLENIRIIDRAKYMLITYRNMSEKEAHRYIEKQAMDMRSTKRAIAEGILKTYEN